MTVTFELRDLEMFWRGRAKALRAIHAVQPLSDATVAMADTYDICADEIKASLAASPTPQIAGDVRENIARIICCGDQCILEDTANGCILKNPEYDGDLKKADSVLAALSPQPQRTSPPFSRWADTIEAASLTISPKGSKELDALAAEVRAGGAAQARLVWEALAPFIKALAGVPATVNDAAPFARVSNDAIVPGTMNIITFGEIRKLLAVLSPQAQAGPSLQKTQGSPAQAGAAAQRPMSPEQRLDEDMNLFNNARAEAFAESVEIAEKYNDCGGDFIAQKIRDAALSLPSTEGNSRG